MPHYVLLLLILLPFGVLGYRRLAARGTAGLVVDGDGFTLKRRWLPAVRIRIAWIDAPEKGQPYAELAREALRALIANRPLKVTYVDTDAFGRRVAQVWAGGEDVGLQLLEGGSAWYYRHYASKVSWFRHWRYGGAERRARSARKGLWAQKKPEAPWDYKHRPWWRRLFF
jgi:endonuclease YncB( thermonuclease family)